jgi:hypothetical protein
MGRQIGEKLVLAWLAPEAASVCKRLMASLMRCQYESSTLQFSEMPILSHLCPQQALRAIRFGAGISHMVTLTVETDDEHRTSVAIARGLMGREFGSVSSLWSGITYALAEAPMTKFVGAAKEFDGVVGVVRS